MDPKCFEELALDNKIPIRLKQYPDNLTWGFKEVRYIDYLDELPSFLNFMARVLPNLGIIFNTREHASVVRNWLGPEKNVKNLQICSLTLIVSSSSMLRITRMHSFADMKE